ncbi:ATP F0F1 synthase subunit B [Rhizobiales bacterium TNE-4]|nr:ATP F0F1 synthase subunit B [Rhizobiales bacterium TNE-4]MBV1826344.1 ATP F0F1 synthase subunit B [Rhizobiales bacterium TNE-4]
MFMTPEFWVAVAFVVFMGVVVKTGAFAGIAKSLDDRAKRIQQELDDAQALHEEAKRVLADYQKRRVEAEQEAAAIVQAAKEEAERFAAESEAKLKDFVARRTALAEQRIAQAEQQASNDVRAAAAEAAIKASEEILRSSVKGAKADALIEAGLKDVRARLN